jgi:hypothetical protein
VIVGRADEIRRDQARAQAARPAILAWLRTGREPLDVARDVAHRFEVEEKQAYRWVAYIAEDFERRRRRIAVAGLALLWPGMLALAGGVILSLFGVRGPGVPLWLLGLIAGVPLSAVGALLATASRRLVRNSL